jgi:hypothetical protein
MQCDKQMSASKRQNNHRKTQRAFRINKDSLMNKKRTAALYSRWVIATLTLILMGAVGCHHGNTLLENETDINQLPTSSVAFKLEQVLGQPGLRPDLGDSELREFDVYLERPDKGLKEEDWMGKDYNATSGLPFALRPKLILVSEVTDRVRDSGTSCYSTAVFPHRFPLTIKTAESQQAKTVLLKVVFGDNTYAERQK